jgi:hypothetical protein
MTFAAHPDSMKSKLAVNCYIFLILPPVPPSISAAIILNGYKLALSESKMQQFRNFHLFSLSEKMTKMSSRTGTAYRTFISGNMCPEALLAKALRWFLGWD